MLQYPDPDVQPGTPLNAPASPGFALAALRLILAVHQVEYRA